MSEQDDRAFIRHFSGIIAALVAFTVVIALLAYSVHRQLTPSENPSQLANAQARLAPVASARTGAPGEQPVPEVVETEPKAVAAAFDGSLDGEMIYNNVCQACHVSGAANAPKLGSDDWAARAEKGIDMLTDHAVNGFNAMPAKGGRMDLTEEQVRATVEYMLAQQ